MLTLLFLLMPALCGIGCFLFLLFVDTLVMVLALVVPVFKNPLKTRVCGFCDAAFLILRPKCYV